MQKNGDKMKNEYKKLTEKMKDFLESLGVDDFANDTEGNIVEREVKISNLESALIEQKVLVANYNKRIEADKNIIVEP